jgi:hypothetical protein
VEPRGRGRGEGDLKQHGKMNNKGAIRTSNAYTVYTKVCGHPFKLVDLGISAKPVAD